MPFTGAIAAGADAAAFGAADVGLAAGADVAAAADVGATFGAAGPALGDVAGGAALGATDLTATALSPDLTASIVPDTGTFGAGATDLTGTVGAAGGDLGTIAGTPGTGVAGISGTGADFFGGTAGDLFSGQGLGPVGGDFGSSFGTFGDVFGGGTPGVGGQAAGGLSDIGSFGGGTAVQAPTGSWMDFPGGEGVTGQGFGAQTAAQDSGPIVSDQGIVSSSNPNFDQTFNEFTTTNQGASLPVDMANRGIPAIDQPALQSDSLFNTGSLTPNTGIEAVPNDFSANLTSGATQTTLTPGGFDTGITTANVTPSAQMIAGAPDVTGGAGVAPISSSEAAGLPTNVPAGPPGWYDPTASGVPPSAAPPAESPAAATPAATAAATSGGVDALTGLRLGTAGINAVTAGLNLSNALNQPSYPALQPIAYPGSPFAPGASSAYTPPLVGQYSGQTPLANSNFAGTGFAGSGAGGGGGLPIGNPQALASQSWFGIPNRTAELAFGGGGGGEFGGGGGGPGTGGISGGLAAGRLTNGLLAGQTPQQLAAEGLISPSRAVQLQSTYTGITDQYAQELGVDPRSLSPGVKQMIAARALADQGLGGR